MCKKPWIAIIAGVSSQVQAEVLRPEFSEYEATPGSQVRVLWLIEDFQSPLLGYSLDLNLKLQSAGTVIANASESNFYEPRNLIVAGGHELSPLFSVINSDFAGGIFLSTNTADFSAVLPVTGVNDVLAEFVFDVSSDASGNFTFELGQGTALSDITGSPVEFSSLSLVIRVVPNGGSALTLGVALALGTCRRRRSR